MRRNSPEHAQPPEQGVGRRRVGLGQVVGAARHDRDPPPSTPIAARSAATSRDGTTSAAPTVVGPAQRGLVPARPAPRRRLGMPAPGHVVHRHDQPAPAGPPRAGGEASETECTMSKPAGARTQPVIPGPGQERPGSRDACSGRPNAASGSVGARGGGPAGQERHLDPVALRRRTRPARRAGRGRRRRCRRARAAGAARRPGAPTARTAQPRPRRRVAVERLEPVAAALPRIARRPRRARRRRGGAARASSLRQAVERLGQSRRDRPRRPAAAPSPEHLGQRAGPGRHHGHAGAHGLQRREAEPLVERGVGQHGGPRQAARPGRAARSQPVRTIRSPAPATRRRPTSSASSPHPGGPARTRATSGWRSATAPKARTSPGRSLRGSAVPTARQKRSDAGRKEPPQHRGGLRLGRDGQVGDAGVDDAHAGGVGPERLDHLARPRRRSRCGPRRPGARARRISPG